MQDIHEYINEYASSEIIRRGEQIFKKDYKLIQVLKHNEDEFIAKVPSSSMTGYYRVEIFIDHHNKTYTSSCTCPYDDFCKHEVAAFLLLDRRNKEISGEITPIQTAKSATKTTTTKAKPSSYEAANATVTMPKLDEYKVLLNLHPDMHRTAKTNSTKGVVKITRTNNQEVFGEMVSKGTTYHIHCRKVGDDIVTACNCGEKTTFPLCVHKAILLLQLLEEDGAEAFALMQDWDKEKAEKLAEYGFTLKDHWQTKFEFKVVGGKLVMNVLDDKLVKINSPKFFEQFNVLTLPKKVNKAVGTSKNTNTTTKEADKLVYVLALKHHNTQINEIDITPLYADIDKKGNIKPRKGISINYGNFDYLKLTDEIDLEILQSISQLSAEKLIYLLRQKGVKIPSYVYYMLEERHFTGEDLVEVHQHIYSIYNLLFKKLEQKTVFYVVSAPKKADRLEQTEVMPTGITAHFRFEEDAEGVLHCTPTFWHEEQQIFASDIVHLSFHAVFTTTKVYPIKDYKTYLAIRLAYNYPSLSIPKRNRESIVKNMIIPLMKNCKVELPPSLQVKEKRTTEQVNAKLYLEEENDYLKLTPLMEYGDHQVSPTDEAELVVEEDGVLTKIKRDRDLEEEMYQVVATSNDNFIAVDGSFWLASENLLDNNWFLDAFELYKEKGFEILGYNNLKTFRYNINKPTVKWKAGSGIDWFDVNMEVSFGEQMVNLKDIRRALLNQQHFVKLDDGSLGILPQEWLEKFSAIFKLGEINKKGVRLSKVHFSLLDELAGEIDDSKLLKELADKKRKLLNFNEVKKVELPTGIEAQLRNYQEGGYQWLNFLDEFGWGGCLADDMGLGKTLQMLTFLKGQIDKYPNKTNLVVVPTSLIYNWANEIKKFIPTINFLVHYGSSRSNNILEDFSKYHLVITTYGIVVNDIEELMKFPFRYVVLDEAQAIKNVASQRYKAVNLLQAENRLTMTGTPVENNTSELFAQLNFANKGILGNYEFFKQEYGTPIDKNGDQAKVQELRKIVYPFILRRTKEKVATDLPEKTETILFCDMPAKQRKVYEAFKNHYRELIMGKIEEEGVAAAQMNILEGLLKLRQICDSPALLNDKEKYDEESIKLEMLTEQLLEITQNHKVLVFSQFLGMLELVKKRLVTHKIPYLYLDGQTKDRQDVVNTFQEDDNTKVFLISLKAGGVGLNLTAAQYVFLIDPWWNPAVEAQAIDRTHRIGQKNSVFAYKMICKDTVEEKILKLQEKKKNLADDIVSADNSIMKKLTKEDIEELFS
jgi:non-specific serine/threonine protein kinase